MYEQTELWRTLRRSEQETVENGSVLESDTLLAVTILLVRHLDEVDSSVSNFEDRETIKSWKMFKDSSKARCLREQRRQNGLKLMFPVYRSTVGRGLKSS